MKAELAFVGARVVDSLPYSQAGTRAQAKALACSGIDGLVGYLGAIRRERIDYLLEAGLSFQPVTFAGEYNDGAEDELAELRALEIPSGVTVWLDLEGMKAFRTPAVELAAKINAWAGAIAQAGWQPGLYVGSPQPFTSSELYALRPVRYWQGMGATRDRHGQLAEPSCGWCMTQAYPQGFWKDTEVFVDVNLIGQDYRGRLPIWCVA